MNTIESKNSQGATINLLANELISERLFVLNEENKAHPNCIDGRDSDEARPSIPGGKFGALAVVFATLDGLDSELTDETRIQALKIVKKKFNGVLGGHTDTEKLSNTPGCECDGCGHVLRLLTEGTTEKYCNMNKQSIDLLRDEISSVDSQEITVLEGKHEERNVIIVNASNYGVKSSGSGGQDFVYNAAYATELYSELASELSELLQVSEQIVQDKIASVAEAHLMSTAGDLAAGKDIYSLESVSVDGVPDIQYLGKIPEQSFKDQVTDVLEN